MKNPYYFNFMWLSLIIIILGAILLLSCCCGDYCFLFKPRTENILIGIFSSAILLLLVEIIQFSIDQTKYSFLKGTYFRESIAGINEGGVRSSDIIKDEREKREKGANIRFINDSCYHELLYYECDKVKYFIKLNYLFHGIYSGTVEYYDHINSKPKEGVIKKTTANFTFNLNLANKMIGTGSYKYVQKDDYGKYEFQIDEENKNRIIVSYENTIPSGLSKGYEIWKKIK